MTITRRSTYDQCVKEIDAAVQEFMLDQAEADLPEDEVWTDLAASLLIEASPVTGREVCRVQLGFVPQDLERLWLAQEQARIAAAKAKAQAKAEARRQERQQAEKDARHAERDAVRAARCPKCFTLPSAAGSCLCV